MDPNKRIGKENYKLWIQMLQATVENATYLTQNKQRIEEHYRTRSWKNCRFVRSGEKKEALVAWSCSKKEWRQISKDYIGGYG